MPSNLAREHHQLKYLDPQKQRIGQVDCYGNFLIEMREHHVYLDERSFFSKIMWGDKLKQEREAKIEAFSKI